MNDITQILDAVQVPNVEAARLLGIPERTAKRRWACARAWLHEWLSGTS